MENVNGIASENLRHLWDPDFSRLTPAEAAAIAAAEAEIERGETVSDDEIDWDAD